MNAAVSFSPDPIGMTCATVAWFTAELQQPVSGGWQLADGRLASVAIGCLVQLQQGDLVLGVETDQGCFVTQLLDRSDSKQGLTLGTTGQPLKVQADQLQLLASQSLQLGSLKDCDISAPRGLLSMHSARMNTTVLGSWVQSARTTVCRFGDLMVNVKQLLRLHGRRQQLSADKELKVDAEIIHMG